MKRWIVIGGAAALLAAVLLATFELTGPGRSTLGTSTPSTTT